MNLDFWCSYKSKSNGGKLLPLSSFRNLCKACYEVVWSPQLVLLNERRSYTDARIAVVNSCTACICILHWCRMNKLQLSIDEWLRDDEETILVFFCSWSRYFSFMYFHVFFDKLSNKLLWFFCLFVCFSMKLHFPVFQELKRFSSGAILSFGKNNLT